MPIDRLTAEFYASNGNVVGWVLGTSDRAAVTARSDGSLGATKVTLVPLERSLWCP